MNLDWEKDARTIREWVSGGAVSIDRLLNEFDNWSAHFTTAAPLDERDHIAARTNIIGPAA